MQKLELLGLHEEIDTLKALSEEFDLEESMEAIKVRVNDIVMNLRVNLLCDDY